MKSKEEWEKHYEQEDPFGAGSRWILERKRIFNSYNAIPKNRNYDHTLDLASGEGHFTEYLCGISKKIISVEISENASNRAKKRLAGKKVEFIISDIQEIDFPRESFDLVCAIEALCYCKDKEKEIEKWSSWLKPQGVLIATGAILSGYFTWNGFMNLFMKQFRKVTPIAVSSKFPLAKLANHHLVPFPETIYDMSMELTKQFPRHLTKHLAIVAHESDKIG
jgi:ubiquinone/menaquinone biosynthesis C-methylase UbiE